jgi:23S rRNA (uracil1939-C5)-methyltransferase
MKNQQNDSQIVEIVLENPAYGGDTIGRLPDGRAVFVPFSIPGEKVKIRIVMDKKKYARGELVEILEPAPLRIQPRCQHFSICGGCHYQHVAYEQQLEIKHRILRDQLERIGGIENPYIEPVTPSPSKFNYRNHIQFKISKNNKPGFFRADKNGIVEIEECHLPDEKINQLWSLLDIEPETGVSALGLRLGADEDIMMTLESPHMFDAEFNLESLPVSVVHLSPEGSQILAGSPYTIMQVKGMDFQVSAGSFFQINIPLVEKMIALIEERIPAGAGLLLELYSGVGLFSAFIASRVSDLIAIESSETAGEDFAINLDQFDNVELYQGRVDKILPLLDIAPEIVLLDPPRTGIKKSVLERIMTLNPELIVYISCDPATLARDGKVLVEGGYNPEKFIPFDFFSQTFHIETLSFWSKV